MCLPSFHLFAEKQCALWIKEEEMQVSQSLFYMFLDCALITFCSQLAYHSPLVVRADGYLKMASDLAGVGCVEGTRCQPNVAPVGCC